MENKIKITKDLKFDYQDLMRIVDFDTEFTLRDILRASVNSNIPSDVLGKILRCGYYHKYWTECNSAPFSDDGSIEHLEVYWLGVINNYDEQVSYEDEWVFHGLGREGVIPEDMKEYYSSEKIQELINDKYREKYAIEFSPVYKICDYVIKKGERMQIDDWTKKDKDIFVPVQFKPDMTLIQLLYTIFWELSFMGQPEDRDKATEELNERVKNIDLSKCIPFQEVKAKLLEKYNIK